MTGRLSTIQSVTPQCVATAALNIETAGAGFTEFTSDVARFLTEAGADEGILMLISGTRPPRW